MKLSSNTYIEVIKHFSTLNQENQNKILAEIILLNYKQTAEKEVRNSNDFFTINETIKDTLISQKQTEYINNAINVIEKIKYFDNKQQAEFIYLVEKIKPGVYSTEDILTINLKSTKLSVLDYLTKNYPDINIKEMIQEAEQLIK